MALTLVATPSDATANTYVTIAEANTYFEQRLNGESWASASADDRQRALLMSCRHLENLSFRGFKAESTQALSFPRYPEGSDEYLLGIPHLMGSYAYSDWVDTSGVPIIPNKIKYAQLEQAFFLLTNMAGIDKRENIRSQGVSEMVVANLRETYSSGTQLAEAAMRLVIALNALDTGIRIQRA